MGLLDILTGNNAAASPWGMLYPSPLQQPSADDFAKALLAQGETGLAPGTESPFGDPTKVSVAMPQAPAPDGFGRGAVPFGFAGPGSNRVMPDSIAAPAPAASPAPAPTPAPGPASASAPAQAAPVAQPPAAPSDLSYVNVGNYKMPVIGKPAAVAEDDDEEDVPAKATPTSGTLPTGTAPAPLSLGGSSPDFSDRLSLAGRGFLGNMQGGPIQALLGGLGALVSGKPTDAATISQQKAAGAVTATGQALLTAGAPPPAVHAAVSQAAAGNVAPLNALFTQYYGPDKFQHVTRKDAEGNETPGAFDPTKGTYKWASVPADPNEAGGTVMGPNGKPIAIPPGVNRKEFVKRVTEANADAASGKLTEAQAKASSFAARMQQAEGLMGGLQNEGLSLAGAGLNAIPGGNLLQSEKYQKYQQAKSAFVTALLRQESGAAISKSEFERYDKELFPQPGDSPSVVQQKAAMRATAIEQMKRGAGPGYQSPAAAPSTQGLPSGWSVQVR
jgi:hypothetical protein